MIDRFADQRAFHRWKRKPRGDVCCWPHSEELGGCSAVPNGGFDGEGGGGALTSQLEWSLARNAPQEKTSGDTRLIWRQSARLYGLHPAEGLAPLSAAPRSRGGWLSPAGRWVPGGAGAPGPGAAARRSPLTRTCENL